MSLSLSPHGVRVSRAVLHALSETSTGAPAPQPGAQPVAEGQAQTLPQAMAQQAQSIQKELPLSANSVDLANLGPLGGDPKIILSVSSDKGEGQVTVPLGAPPGDRNRGWAQLECTLQGVLAYQLFKPPPGQEGQDAQQVQGGDKVVLIAWPGPADFMGALPDDWSFGDVSLCGTHESAALVGYFISKCQSRDIATQLNEGVRVFDIRLRLNNGELEVYHGIRPQYSTLRVQLDAINAFLQAHPREAVMVSLKEETPPDVPDFSKAVYDLLKSYGDRFVYTEHVPRLGEIRGRAQIMTRFGRKDNAPWSEGYGFHPNRWPDSERNGFECDCNGTPVRISDWYAIDSPLDIPAKADAVIQSLTPTTTCPPGSQITMAFASASKFPAATPQWCAKGVGLPTYGLGMYGINERVAHWILLQAAQGRRPRAIVMADYYDYAGSGDAGLGRLLGAVNFIQS